MVKKYYTETILSNKVQCHKCGDIIESKHRHDFKWCSCGNVAVDGGKSYLKRAFNEQGTWTELSKTRQEERERYEWEKE
jgi:tRNA(Ile2) C34 agmatinyltransferase TiaS